MNDRGAYRVSHGSPAEHTLGFESLPRVGENRERGVFRARVWRMILASLVLFWAGVVWLIAGAG